MFNVALTSFTTFLIIFVVHNCSMNDMGTVSQSDHIAIVY
jgi:hypothetical protein